MKLTTSDNILKSILKESCQNKYFPYTTKTTYLPNMNQKQRTI